MHGRGPCRGGEGGVRTQGVHAWLEAGGHAWQGKGHACPGGVHGRQACMFGGHVAGGYVWQGTCMDGACMAGSVCLPRGHVWQAGGCMAGGMHSRRWGCVPRVCVPRGCVPRGMSQAGGCMAGSVHGRGACMAGVGVCVAGGCALQGWGGVCGRPLCMAGGVLQGVCMAGGMHSQGHAWQGACIPRGMHGWGACMAGGVHAQGACVAGRGCAWQGVGACMPRRVCMAGGMCRNA